MKKNHLPYQESLGFEDDKSEKQKIYQNCLVKAKKALEEFNDFNSLYSKLKSWDGSCERMNE